MRVLNIIAMCVGYAALGVAAVLGLTVVVVEWVEKPWRHWDE